VRRRFQVARWPARSLPSLALLAALLAPASARARLTEEHSYEYDQVWRAAVRLVAVDLRFPITDRDAEIGYVLFEYQDHGRSYQGSIELVRAEGGERIRVVVQVPGMPSYVERMILDRFSRKLLDEYGPPRVRRPAPAPPPPEDDEEESEEDAPAPGGRRA
jgi:hypothetical protein